MSYKKAALEQSIDPTKDACSYYWQAVCESMAISRPVAFLGAFISLSCLLGVATPTSTQAQTASYTLPLDSNGWTVFTPSSDTHIIYVSDSTGNDSTGVVGDSTHPYKTLAKGMSLLRGGYPDWLLLKKGDTWTNQSLSNINMSGRSATEPMLFSSYGTGAQPLIQVSAALTNEGVGPTYGYSADYIAVVDIDFYAYLRDPSGPFTESGLNVFGAFWAHAPENWILIEGCQFRFFTIGAYIYATENGWTGTYNYVIQNLFLRRDIVVDNSAHGVLIDGISPNFVFEENLFDHNYYDSGTPSNMDHNFYIGGYKPDGTVVTPNTGITAYAYATGNISTRDPSGSHFRSGGTIKDNFFAYDDWAFDVGGLIGGPTTYVTNNVVQEPTDRTGPSVGLWTLPQSNIYNNDNYNGLIVFQNNIVNHSSNPTNGGGGIYLTTGFTNVTATNNIVCGWDASGAVLEISAGDIITPNSNKTADCNTGGWTNQPPGLIDGTRTIETYDSAILGGPGTFAHFIGLARQQSKGNWNPALKATAINNYIRAGFGMSSSTTSTSTGTTSSGTTSSGTTSGGTTSSGTTSSGTTSSGTTSSGTTSTGTTSTGTTSTGTTSTGTTSTGTTSTGTTSTGTTSSGTSTGGSTSTGTTSTGTSSTGSTSTSSTGTSAPTPPTVTISSPVNGSTINSSVNVAVSANSASGIASITITVDGNTYATCTHVTSCSATWQNKKITRGTHTIAAIAIAASPNGLPATASVTFVKL
jgi:mucin-2